MPITSFSNIPDRLNSDASINILILTDKRRSSGDKYRSLLENQNLKTIIAGYFAGHESRIAALQPDLIFLDEGFIQRKMDIEVKTNLQDKYHVPVLNLLMDRIDHNKIPQDSSDLCGYYYHPSPTLPASIFIDLVLFHYLFQRENLRKEYIYRSFIKPIADLNLIVDFDGEILEQLPAGKYDEYTFEWDSLRNITQLVHQDDVDLVKAMFREAAQNRSDTAHCKFRAQTRSGSYRYLEAQVFPAGDHLEASALALVCFDPSNPIHPLNAFRESKANSTVLIDALPVPVYISDLSLNFRFVNRAWLEFTGKSLEDELEENWKADLHPEDLEKFVYLFARAATQRQDFKTEIRFFREDGEMRWMLINGALRFGEDGIPQEFIGACIDISEYKNIEESLYYLASHDSLTGLYNRSFYEEEITRFEKSSRFPISIVVADIDGMKLANDAFGHRAGDELLRRSAKVLLETFRSEDIIARIGGDEFAILLPDTEEEAALEAIARVRSTLRNQIREFPEFPLRLSMGAATTNKELPLNEALIVADRRMYGDKLLKR